MTDVGNSRELVLDILIEILEKGGPSHVVLRQALGKYQYLSKQDRAFITRVTEGTLEYLIQIDYILDSCSKTPVAKMKPVIRNILRMSVYQILYLDRIPDSAACNEAVKLAGKRHFQGLKGFVNGILRRISREKEKITESLPGLSVRLSAPEWLTAMWNEELGKERTEEILKAFLRERPVTVRCNESLAGREEILKSLESQGVTCHALPSLPGVLELSGYDYLESLEAFQQGWIQVQDTSSVLAGLAAAPKKGSFVLDVCAAPGGKSIHAADLLAGTGMVEARDITEKKAALIEENVYRCGFSNIRTKVWDALVPDESVKAKADVVLADLPCSGLGIIGKKPDIKLRMTKESADSLASLQREILSVVWQYVKPGGILVYSTCTIHKAENQENAAWFLEHFPFVPVDLTERIGAFVQPVDLTERIGAYGQSGALFQDSLKEGWVQLLPGSGPWDGFFFSVMQRKE